MVQIQIFVLQIILSCIAITVVCHKILFPNSNYRKYTIINASPIADALLPFAIKKRGTAYIKLRVQQQSQSKLLRSPSALSVDNIFGVKKQNKTPSLPGICNKYEISQVYYDILSTCLPVNGAVANSHLKVDYVCHHNTFSVLNPISIKA